MHDAAPHPEDPAVGDVDTAPVDVAIAEFLRTASLAGDTRARPDLLRHGATALHRAIGLYYDGDVSVCEVVADASEGRHPREVVDAWARLFGVLARAFPETYLDGITHGRVRVFEGQASMEIHLLGTLDHPDAAAVLRRYSTHADRLVRLQAVTALRGFDDAASVRVVEAAVTDDEPQVRAEASRTLRRRDPVAAAALRERLLAETPDSPLAVQHRRELATARRSATRRRTRTGPAQQGQV